MISRKKIIKIAEKAVEQSFKAGKLDDKKVELFTREFSQLPKAEAIPFLNEYHKGIKRELDKQTLIIESAIILPSDKVKKIEAAVKKEHQVSKVETLVNPGLLGGIKIKIADEVFEGSLLRQIEELGNYIKGGGA